MTNLGRPERGIWQKIRDVVTLPARSFFLFEGSRWGLSSTQDERFEYAAREVQGHCLDVGCGKFNRFVNVFLGGNGKGVDVFLYDGLTAENLVADMTHLPFPEAVFDSVTFIANLNHVPKNDRDKELREAYRCLKVGGNIIITMPCAFAGILIHKIVHVYDQVFGTHYDVDSIRGMHHDETYFLRDPDIINYLTSAGFTNIRKKYFWTQWGMNHLFVGWKRS